MIQLALFGVLGTCCCRPLAAVTGDRKARMEGFHLSLCFQSKEEGIGLLFKPACVSYQGYQTPVALGGRARLTI